MIYFIRAASSVKIGHVEDRSLMRHRLMVLQIGSPLVLSVLGVMDGDMERERELHVRFSADRYLGEWFHMSPPIVEFIEDNCRPYIADVDRRNADAPRRVQLVIPTPYRNSLAREQDDILMSFISQHIVEGGKAQASFIYDALTAYFSEADPTLAVPSIKYLALRLSQAGYKKVKSGGLMHYNVTVHPPLIRRVDVAEAPRPGG